MFSDFFRKLIKSASTELNNATYISQNTIVKCRNDEKYELIGTMKIMYNAFGITLVTRHQ